MPEDIENIAVSEEEFRKIRTTETLRVGLSSQLIGVEEQIGKASQSRGETKSARQQIIAEIGDIEGGRVSEVMHVQPKANYEHFIATVAALNRLKSKYSLMPLISRDDIIGQDYLSAEAISAYVNDPETEEALEKTGAWETYGYNRHVGKIIELKRFFTPSEMLRPNAGGSQPEHCLIKRTVGTTDDWNPQPAENRKGNLTKYQLFDYSPRSLDEGKELKELRFQTYKHEEYMKYLGSGLLTDNELRITEGNPDPLDNKIPNPFGIHAIISFSGLDSFLCLLRRPGIAFEANTISFGCDEQLDNADFSVSPVPNLDHLINRLVLEEVFPTAYVDQTSKDGQEILNKSVLFKKVLTLIYAENYCCHNAVAFVALNLTPEEYVAYYEELAKLKLHDFVPSPEDEGRRLTMNFAEVRRFLETGRGSLSSPFRKSEHELVVDQLLDDERSSFEHAPHVSTFYRMNLVRQLIG